MSFIPGILAPYNFSFFSCEIDDEIYQMENFYFCSIFALNNNMY